VSQPPVNQRPQRPPGPPPGAGRPGPSHPPRSGAHRPRRPLWHDILPAAVVLVAVLALVFGFYQLKDSVLGTTSNSTSDTPDTSAQDDQPNAPTAPLTTSPSATSTASPSRTSSPPPPVQTVNHDVRVKVYNATSRTGLAKGAAGKLGGAGWKASSAGNQTGFGGSTTVYYTRATLRATAKAIAKDLGGYPVKLSTAYGSSGVVVILAGDYSG
jgi:cytoskeletal protein RodZ